MVEWSLGWRTRKVHKCWNGVWKWRNNVPWRWPKSLLIWAFSIEVVDNYLPIKSSWSIDWKLNWFFNCGLYHYLKLESLLNDVFVFNFIKHYESAICWKIWILIFAFTKVLLKRKLEMNVRMLRILMFSLVSIIKFYRF